MQNKPRSRVFTVGCALTVFSVLSPLHAGSRTPITFSGVTSHQRLVIDYQTVAETDTPGYAITFKSTPKPLFAVKCTGPYFGIDRNRQGSGSFALSHSQVVLLDNLLRYYRKHDKEGGCTTQHYVTLSLMEGNTVLRKEKYVDATCQAEMVASATSAQRKALKLTDPPLLTFDDVIDAIYKHRKTIETLQPLAR